MGRQEGIDLLLESNSLIGHGLTMPGQGMSMPGDGFPMPGHGCPMPGHGLPMLGHGLPVPGRGGALPKGLCQGGTAKGILPRGSCHVDGWCGLVGVDGTRWGRPLGKPFGDILWG